jgi:hypothetical protein
MTAPFGGIMLVDVLLDTTIYVHYGFLRLGAAETDPTDLEDAFRGHVNGLCGGAVPGQLNMRTGTHTGHIPVRIELHTDEPALDDSWQDVVETSFSTEADELWLTAFDSAEGPVDLPPGWYQVRYCAADMERADEETPDGRPADRYLWQFWPANGVDRIVRQGGGNAAYWHRDGTQPAWTREELAQRVRDLRSRRARRQAEEDEDELLQAWDGQVPDDPRLREAGWAAAQLHELDPELVQALAEADDVLRREVIAWVIEQMLGEAGLLDRPWAAPALDSLRNGTALPDRWEITETLPPMPVAGYDPAAQQHLAVEAMFNAGVVDTSLYPGADNNTLREACMVLTMAATEPTGITGVFERVRQAFPRLA